jgi:DNA-binding winged helix-turn-helix (wHTH) protein/TolB-like protein/lipoprotein NlpI
VQAEHYTFGPFRLYPSEQLLLRGETALCLAPKVFEVLVALVEQHGHLVTRDVLMQKVWPDSFVEETNLTVNISLLRKMFGELPDGRPYIATVPKRGYRFDAPITHVTGKAKPVEALAEPAPAQLNAGLSNPLEARPLEPSPAQVSPARPSPELPMPAPPASGPVLPGLAAGPVDRRKMLRWGVGVLILCAVGWFAYRSIRTAERAHAGLRSLAVLPFQTLDTRPEDQYLGLGMADALITHMDRLPQIVVRPLAAVRTFPPAQDPVQAGKRLGVEAVLDGTIQRLSGQTRVTARLLRVSDGSVLWSDSFDETQENPFALEDSISQKLTQALSIHLTDEEQRHFAQAHAPNRDAYALYTQGRFFWNKRGMGSIEQSIDFFQRAIAADPDYAAAYSGLADAYLLAGTYGSSFLAPAVALPKARDAVEKALALDPGSPEAHTSLAYIRLLYDRDWSGAEREFKQAIALNPGYVNAHHWYSHELVALGRMEESHRESETAMSLDPTDVVVNEHMAWHHLMAREYDKAIPQANKAIELDPTFVQSHRVLALGYLYTGRNAEACAEFQRGVELSHDDPVAEAYLARCYAVSHREKEAREILERLKIAATERYVSAAEIAAVYAALGDANSTALWLNKAYQEHAGALIYVNADRVFDGVRNDPGVRGVIAQLAFPGKGEGAGSR